MIYTVISMILGIVIGYYLGFNHGYNKGVKITRTRSPLYILENSLREGHCLICGEKINE